MTPASVVPADSETPAPRRRTSSRALVGLLVVAALVAGGGWWLWNDQWRDRAPVGVLPGELQVFAEREASASFRLPDGREMVVSTQVGVESDGSVRPPRGGRLVETQWRITDQNGVPALVLYQGQDLQRVGLRLATGGREVDLGGDVAAQADEGSAVLALPGDVDELTATVSYAGRRQSVELFTGRRDAGSFRSLYRARGRTSIDVLDSQLPESGNGGLVWTSWVTAGWQRTPYVAGRGWAPTGREWVVVTDPALEVTSIWGPGDRRTRLEPPQPESPGGVSASGARVVSPPVGRVPISMRSSSLSVEFPEVVLDAPYGAPVRVRLWVSMQVERESDAPRRVRFERTWEVPAAVDLA